MLSLKNRMKTFLSFALIGSLILLSCNQEFEDIAEVPIPPAPSGSSINEILNTDTTFSFFKAAVAKAGLTGTLGNKGLGFTAFLPDNNAFRLSGIPSAAVLNAAFDTATTRSFVNYLIIPQVLPVGQIPTTFPNIQRPTLLNPAPQLSAFLRLSTFPSRRANGAWINNIPLTATDIIAANGIIHKTLVLVAPPTRVLLDTISRDTSLTFLVAALARADSGRSTIADTSLIEIAKSIGANLTAFAPTNSAFRDLLMAFGLPPSPSSFGFLPVRTLRGLIAYHILPVRAFSVNMPTTTTNVPAFGTPLIPGNSQLAITATFTGPFATFTVKGAGNATPSNVVTKDVHAVNGVIHKIDQVLRPQ